MPTGSGPRAPKGAAGGGRWVTAGGRRVHVSDDGKTVAIPGRASPHISTKSNHWIVTEDARPRAIGPYESSEAAARAAPREVGGGGYTIVKAPTREAAKARRDA